MKVIYVDGTFDLPHTGHIEFLKKAKSYGDYLIVGIISDNNVEKYKRKPILNMYERGEIIKNFYFVDKVIIDCPFCNIEESFLEENNISKVIYAGKNIDSEKWIKHYQNAIDKNLMEFIEYSSNKLSTTKIINKIKNLTLKV